MEPENEVTLLEVIRNFNRHGIRYLIIGRRAVILYGGPVLTGDNDIWIDVADRKKALTLLEEELGFEFSHPVDTKRPIVTGFSGMRKYDLFFHKSSRNTEGETIHFKECYRNAAFIEDPAEDISFRVPSIDDLIRLKKIRKPNVKDEQDIEYLLRAKSFHPRNRK
ncbi:MAG: hypothetical protein JXL84_04765 [Deltaproteobacteria bacterium]|nr:hypothetical protein [Deltaproteobacteria bacterium]